MSFVRLVCVCPAFSIFVELEVCPFDAPADWGDFLRHMPSKRHKDDVGSHWCQHLTSFVQVVCVCPAG